MNRFEILQKEIEEKFNTAMLNELHEKAKTFILTETKPKPNAFIWNGEAKGILKNTAQNEGPIGNFKPLFPFKKKKRKLVPMRKASIKIYTEITGELLEKKNTYAFKLSPESNMKEMPLCNDCKVSDMINHLAAIYNMPTIKIYQVTKKSRFRATKPYPYGY